MKTKTGSVITHYYHYDNVLQLLEHTRSVFLSRRSAFFRAPVEKCMPPLSLCNFGDFIAAAKGGQVELVWWRSVTANFLRLYWNSLLYR